MMAPKIKFTPQMIIDAALSIWEHNTLNQITARKLAKKLNATTSIIYRNFRSLDHLRLMMIEQLSEEIEYYLFEQYDTVQLLNPGTGITLFAQNTPEKFLILLKHIKTFSPLLEKLHLFYRTEIKRDIRFSLFTQQQQEMICNDLWRYSFGTATMIATDQRHQYSRESLISDQLRFGKLRLTIAFQEKRHSSQHQNN